MRKTIRVFFIFICLTLSWCATTSNAFALVCYLGSDTTAKDDKDTLNVLAYLGNKAIGERIWTSKVFSRNITCRSELVSGSENVYIYPYPKRKTQKMPNGVKMGLIFDGKDLGTFDNNGNIEDSRIDTHWTVRNMPETRLMKFQVYLIRTGEISTSGVKDVTLFQLDGRGGLNKEQSNYNISLSGWDNIGSVNCTGSPSGRTASLSFNPGDIIKGSAIGTAPETIGMSINCTSPNPNILDYIKSVETAITIKTGASSDNSQHYPTNVDGLSVAIRAKNKDMIPGRITKFTVPLSSGRTVSYIPLEITPHFSSFSLNQPSWLFSDNPVNIRVSLPYTFSIEDINL